MTYEEIVKANSTIKTTDIKGKDYAEVNQRIKAFRMVYPTGRITTTMLRNENGVCVFYAQVGFYDAVGEYKELGTGTAQEKEDSSFINKTSYIENCETSAVGRALGMCGFGIDTSIASYEEVVNAIEQQDKTKAQGIKCVDCFKDVVDTKKKNGEPWKAEDVKAYSIKRYGRCLCPECMKKTESNKGQ